MKKTKALVILLCAMMLCACGKGNANNETTVSAQETEAVSDSADEQQESSQDETSSADDVSSQEEESSQIETSSQTETTDAGEYITYEDDNLSYEIPADWSYDGEYSAPDMMISMFSPTALQGQQPSSVVVQINSLGNQVPDDVDFADEEIMQNFLAFVESSVSMENPEISGYESGDLYVYKLVYTKDGIKQIGYYPQKFDYTVSIYATDYEDGVTPNVEEVAERIIETMKIKK